MNGAFQVGRVADRQPETGSVRVVFDDRDALVSAWLPVVQPKTLRDALYWLPDLDETVVCLFDAEAEFGVVLGSIYSDPVPPPVASGDRWHARFADGTALDYDRAAHRLVVDLPAGGAAVEIRAAGAVTVTSTAADVTLSVSDGQHVYVGGAAGAKRVATEEHVKAYLQHTHPTPVGMSGPPIPTGTELQWPQVSAKAVVE